MIGKHCVICCYCWMLMLLLLLFICHSIFRLHFVINAFSFRWNNKEKKIRNRNIHKCYLISFHLWNLIHYYLSASMSLLVRCYFFVVVVFVVVFCLGKKISLFLAHIFFYFFLIFVRTRECNKRRTKNKTVSHFTYGIEAQRNVEEEWKRKRKKNNLE